MSETAEKPSPAPSQSKSPQKDNRPNLDHPATEVPHPPSTGRVSLSQRDHWQLLALAALGATFGFLTGLGLWNEIHFRSVEFILAVIPAALAAYVLYDPLQEWMQGKHETENAEHSERRGIAAVAMAALAMLVVSAFHHSLDSALGEDLGKLAEQLKELDPLKAFAADLQWMAERLHAFGEFGAALIFFCCVGGCALAITYFWIQGARRDPRRSAHWGAVAGLALDIVGCLALTIYLGARHLFHFWPTWIVLTLALFWFFVPGLLGGLALHKQETNSSPTGGILRYLAISSAIYVFLLLLSAWVLEIAFPEYKELINSLIWLPIGALAFQNAGWALGPYSRRKSCDGSLCALGGKSRAAANPANHGEATKLAALANENSLQQTSGMLLEMPLRNGTSIATAAIGDEGVSTAEHGSMIAARAHAKEMLLKPRGSRLWASLALVLALVTSALAYKLGTLRPDRDIDGNIDSLLQQDSGLRTKGLQVVSAGGVVTVGGTVDDEAEHTMAIQQAASVRGVRQVIDRVQIAPRVPVNAAGSATSTPGSTATNAQPALGVNASIAITNGSRGSVAANARSANAGAVQRSVPQPKTNAADAQKHQGILHFLRKEKTAAVAQAKTQTQPQKTAVSQNSASQNASNSANSAANPDAQKHKGFFHFLKKNKDKDQDKNKTKSNN